MSHPSFSIEKGYISPDFMISTTFSRRDAIVELCILPRGAPAKGGREGDGMRRMHLPPGRFRFKIIHRLESETLRYSTTFFMCFIVVCSFSYWVSTTLNHTMFQMDANPENGSLDKCWIYLGV